MNPSTLTRNELRGSVNLTWETKLNDMLIGQAVTCYDTL